MTDIPIHAKVFCADSDHACGHTTYLVLNPVTDEMTHIVVQRGVWPRDECLVPINLVAESDPYHVRLSCSRHELAAMDAFIETEFIRSKVQRYSSGPDPYPYSYVVTWPFRYPEIEEIPVEHERIPVGELAVHRGARVEATDGYVGHVDGFLVDGSSRHITHLVLREGHLWNQKDVTIPVSTIDRIEEDIVHLKVDKKGIEHLPVAPAQP